MSTYHDRNKGATWRWLRSRVFARADFACQNCGKRSGDLECDHVMPVEEGGKSDLDNLQALCRDCHMAKTRRESGAELTEDQLAWERFAAAPPRKRDRLVVEGKRDADV